METRYGLSRAEILNAFYRLNPNTNESESSFILRVEQLRERYNVPEDRCFDLFIHKLKREYREKMEEILAATSMFGGADEKEVDWATMVNYARWKSRYSRCVPEKATHYIKGLGEQHTTSA